MMEPDPEALAQKLYDLLPAVYRLRDAESGEPLRQLVATLAEQIAVQQESLEQAYDDLFIETCARWVVPYIGDLIGARPVFAKAPASGGGRSEVANTLGLRRRKGTLAALEQAARSVTGFPAVAVEYFTRMAQTQAMNHVRLQNHYTTSVRDELALERLNSAFDNAAHIFEARRIASGRGRYNIPNIGLHLFRLRSFALHGVSAAKVDDFRYTFHPLGIDCPLYNDPQTEVSITQFAGPENVPLPVSRIAMKQAKEAYYGASQAIFLEVDGTPLPASQVAVCDLRDLNDGSGNWAHAPDTLAGIDPRLGRIALPTGSPAAQRVTVAFRYGFSDAIGGGEYERGAEIETPAAQTVNAANPDVQSKLDAVAAGGVLEFGDSGSYALASAAPNLTLAAEQTVEIRSANGARPLLQLSGGDWIIHGEAGSRLVINGLLIAGGALRITGAPASVTLRHCTLTPGVTRTRQNEPAQPDAALLIVEADNVAVELDRCICGAIQSGRSVTITVGRSILDATGETGVVFGGPAAQSGGTLLVENSTLIGRVHTYNLQLASNSIFAARSPGGGELPLRSERTQSGCVRFCATPPGGRTPRRHRCTEIPPVFTSLRFGAPGYAQLAAACAPEIAQGAEDESEMGVFHDLYLPQRLSDLRTRMDEYLRFGMEAGVFFGS